MLKTLENEYQQCIFGERDGLFVARMAWSSRESYQNVLSGRSLETILNERDNRRLFASQIAIHSLPISRVIKSLIRQPGIAFCSQTVSVVVHLDSSIDDFKKSNYTVELFSHRLLSRATHRAARSVAPQVSVVQSQFRAIHASAVT